MKKKLTIGLCSVLALFALALALPSQIYTQPPTNGNDSAFVLVESSPNVFNRISLRAIAKYVYSKAGSTLTILSRGHFGSLLVDSTATFSGTATFSSYIVNGGNTVGYSSVLDSALTGYSSPPTDTLRCSADFYSVTCYFVAGITGTSNGTALTVGHLPANFRPGHTVVVDLSSVTNNGVERFGRMSIASTGIGTVSRFDSLGLPLATYCACGTKAIGAGTSFSFSKF